MEQIEVIRFDGKDSWPTREQVSPFKIGLVASFGHMVPSDFIDYFSLGVYVMHPSLLPKFRGACPI